jgi:hypothetical protein
VIEDDVIFAARRETTGFEEKDINLLPDGLGSA